MKISFFSFYVRYHLPLFVINYLSRCTKSENFDLIKINFRVSNNENPRQILPWVFYLKSIKNRYIYQYRDHLGNARISFAKNAGGTLEITDSNNYYPFGLNHIGGETIGQLESYRNYKYNGKELQETGMYDYGARFYMPDLGRWGVVDPLAEKNRAWSPFRYGFNNPIRFIDPDGRNEDIWEFNESTGSLNKTEDNDRPYELFIVDKCGNRKVDSNGDQIKFTLERDGQINDRVQGSESVEYDALVQGKNEKRSKDVPFEIYNLKNKKMRLLSLSF